MNCPNCHKPMARITENVSFSRTGLEIFLQGTDVCYCENCQFSVLPEDVEALVKHYVKEKGKYPNSLPFLFIHVNELLCHQKTICQ